MAFINSMNDRWRRWPKTNRTVSRNLGLTSLSCLSLLLLPMASHGASPRANQQHRTTLQTHALPPQVTAKASHSDTNPINEFAPIRPVIACPTDVDTLSTLLLRDLPSYANRVTQRIIAAKRRSPISAVIAASQPDLEPLSLGPGVYSSDPNSPNQPQQVFFTTLEWRYTRAQLKELQRYHWLFLTQNDRGWWLVLMVSSQGPYPAGQPPTPPRDSSEGILAQAIRIWLKDCQAGAIAPLDEN